VKYLRGTTVLQCRERKEKTGILKIAIYCLDKTDHFISTQEVSFCLEALEVALTKGSPEIFNSDQGSQFTSLAFTGLLKAHAIRISMDGRGRVFDNIFTERFWRTIKYEEVYLHDYQSVREGKLGIGRYIEFYNHTRLHQALNYQTPAEMHFQ
jgi:putative transposase